MPELQPADQLSITMRSGKLSLHDKRTGQVIRGQVEGWSATMQKAGELSIRMKFVGPDDTDEKEGQ